MKANTALCFVLSGGALALVSFPPSVIARRIGQGCAGIVLLVALLTLGEPLTVFDVGIDELLVRDEDTPRDLNPGRWRLAKCYGRVSAGEAGAPGDGAYTLAVCEESEHCPTPNRTAQ